MIMGESVRYRMGTIGFLGIGLVALAALPGCTAGLASEEPALTDEAVPEIVATERGELLAGDPFSKSEPAQAEPGALASDPATVPEPGPSLVTNSKLLPSSEVADPPADLPPQAENQQAAPAGASNEERLKRLEDRFDAILAELRELKNPGGPDRPATERAKPSPPRKTSSYVRAAQQAISANGVAKPESNQNGPVAGQQKHDLPQTPSNSFNPGNLKRSKIAATHREGDVEKVTLTRVTYKMPAEKAQSLAAFLTANLTDEIEVRVKDGALQVTATSEDQTALEQFIQLLKTRAAVAPKPSQPRMDRGKPGSAPGTEPQPGLPGAAAGDELISPLGIRPPSPRAGF